MKYVLFIAAVATLVACAKGGGASAQASASAAAANNPASSSDGATVYVTNCASCHQADGRGAPGAFPPLAGNATVTGNPIAVIAIVKHGLEGRIEVGGQAYSGIMPAWAGVLSDDQIASVVTYVRSSWKNAAAGVTLDQVRSVK
jgi:mono/diheme cytochrome c family protein